ncbi:MAG: cysteine desulfurase [Candidatus Omnitrophica bacterium]|nr:cysteine desulfurase [Candidatus Omnitrophota bacterium]
MKRIYLDNSASTRTDLRVVEAMLPYFSEFYGNASSLHGFGREVKEVMASSRAKIASVIGAKPQEIVFTSSGTESNNFALKGIAFANREKGNHIIVSAIEHDSVIGPCEWLRGQGFAVTYLPVDEDGLIDINDLKKVIRKETIIVSVMNANNEIGTIEPISEVGKICRARGIYFHSDACQSFGRIPIDVNEQCLDLLTINAHKIYGPKGIGALFIREGTKIMPWQQGGGHEMGLRSATENIPAIVGFAKAAELCVQEMVVEARRELRLREKIIDAVLNDYSFAYLNGHRDRRLPNNISFGFAGLEGDAIRLLLELDEMGIAVSSGSACSSNGGGHKTSHVLSAIGLDPVRARGALRISLGRFNTEDEVNVFLYKLSQVLGCLKPLTSVY